MIRTRTSITPTIIALFLLLASGGRAAEDLPILRVDPGGHTAAVRAVLFAPDGRHLISAGLDKVARVWDRSTGEAYALRYQIGPGVEGQSFAAALDGSGKSARVALGSSGSDPRQDADVFLFDYRTRQQTGRLRGHRGAVTGLAFSPDGTRLASGGTDGAVCLWDPARPEPARRWKLEEGGRPAYVSGLAFSPDGGRLAAASWYPVEDGGFAGSVRVWDTGTGREIRTFRWGREVLCVAWSSRGALAYGASDGVIHLWDPRTDAEPQRFAAQPDTVSCLAFTPDGRQMLSGGGERGADPAIRVWSVEEARALRQFRGHDTTVFSVAAAPDGKMAASADALGAIRLWDPATGRELRALTGTGGSAFTLAWSPDGKRLAWGTRFGNETLDAAFDLVRAAPVPRPDADAAWQRALTRRGGLRLARTPDQSALVLRGENDREMGRIEAAPGDRIRCYGFTPRGEVVVGSDQYLALWSVNGKPKRERLFEGHEGPILALAVSPDGKYLAAASADRMLRIWSLEPGASSPRLSLFYGDDFEWVIWTPAGYYAASPAGDDIIGWHINRGPDRAADYRLSFQVRERFYRPDLVPRALGLAAPPAGPTQREQIVRTPAVEIVEIENARPDSDARGPFWRVGTDDATVWVRRSAAPDRDVTFQLHVNHAPKVGFRLGSKDIAGRPGQWPLRARLISGFNTVRIVAVNPAGESRPVFARLRYDAPPEAKKPETTLHVLAVGIRDYADPNIQPLRFADRDAEAIAAAFQAQEGRLFDRVKAATLLNRAATKQSITEGIAGLAKAVEPQDSVVLFLSSHGFPGEVDRGVYLAPWNLRLADLSGTGVAWADILSALQKVSARNLLLIVDHCFSGGVSVELARRFAADNASLRALRENNILTFTSSTSGEVSWEHARWGHGAFTYALLKALRGEADQTVGADGLVLLDLVEPFVRTEVERLVREAYGESVRQRPSLYALPDADRRVPLARVR